MIDINVFNFVLYILKGWKTINTGFPMRRR